MALANSLSGLIAAAKALDVIGNNIANSQTIGFKSSIARFTNVAAAGKGSGPSDSSSSAGVSADNIFQQFEQGKFDVSDNPLDMAISGLGFFRLQDPATGKISYTRDGQFRLSFNANSNPMLETRGGLSLTGNLPDFTKDPFGSFASAPAPVAIAIDPHFPARASSQVNASLNLDSRAVSPTIPFDPENALSYNGSTMATVFDVDGSAHDLRLYLVRSNGASLWNLYTTLDHRANGLAASPVTATGPVALTFDTRGAINTAMPLAAQTYSTSGGRSLSLRLDFTGTTQLGTPFNLNAMSQDGYAEGNLLDGNEFTVLPDGHISARYSNGQRRNVAQVVLANFSNPNALVNTGDNQWVANGDPVRGTGTVSLGFPKFTTEKLGGFKGDSDPAEGMGSIQGHSKEQSNVDLANELVALIEQQRNYQASAQTFKILDQVLQNLANMRSN